MSEYEVCYGALRESAVKVLGRTRLSTESLAIENTTSFISFSIRAKNRLYFLCSDSHEDFAVLDIGTIFKLDALKNIPGVRFEAVAQSNHFTKRLRGKKHGPQSFHVSINVFGSKSVADDVASHLLKVSAYLQHPEFLQSEIEYYNPQFLRFDDDRLDMKDLIKTEAKSPWDIRIMISEEIGNILDSLTGIEVHEDLILPAGLTTALKKHQEDGLRFIIKRENEEFGRQVSAQLRQVTSVRVEESLSRSMGGIIADKMGLGKTLTMLTAILNSEPVADLFSSFHTGPHSEFGRGIRTKATLIVVSSVQLLEGWISEIQTHFSPGVLNWVSFHGQYRPRDPKPLTSVELVLTTYATLAADHTGQGILHQMEWYRVVLDEAHWIRNPSSKQFRAVSALHTRRRWCLTGTPIQNKLDDLTSLAQFLQLPPLSTKAAFQEHILGPLSGGGPNFAKPLRVYLEAYCLRRTEKYLKLPPSQDESVALHFSPEEDHIYRALLNKTRREIDALVSTGENIKCNKLFTAMLRMRMLCNLGTSFSESSYESLGQDQLKARCGRCSDSVTLLSNVLSCPECGRPLSPSSPLPGTIDIDTTANETVEAIDLHPTAQNGFSTKLQAVVQNIKISGVEAKSIVFSYWTSTLDILSRLLEREKITYRRIDGRVSYSERSLHLRAFKEDPQVLVLLMSIQTGAVGLNLAVANRVHIVEPQWNPSVEEQAVARALRMSQTREVTIIRYIMQNTVKQVLNRKHAPFETLVDLLQNIVDL
ncbi:hypothetical protein M426DRAFT_259935 [Hypoxylon sp. CI-4A]|nr:hypothetical protein M426DRAFT_259935 [Hypoxylon sp. CI-4A]